MIIIELDGIRYKYDPETGVWTVHKPANADEENTGQIFADEILNELYGADFEYYGPPEYFPTGAHARVAGLRGLFPDAEVVIDSVDVSHPRGSAA